MDPKRTLAEIKKSFEDMQANGFEVGDFKPSKRASTVDELLNLLTSKSGDCQIVEIQNTDPSDTSLSSPEDGSHDNSYTETNSEVPDAEFFPRITSSPKVTYHSSPNLNESILDQKVENLEKITETLMHGVRSLSQQVEELTSELHTLKMNSTCVTENTNSFAINVENTANETFDINKTFNRYLSKSTSMLSPALSSTRDYSMEKVEESSSLKLKLNWVYGYRGKDCRCNLHFLPTGECVYFVANIVVLFNPSQNTQRHYLGHTDAVKCIAIHPNRLIIASGQSATSDNQDKRPIVRVWNTVSLATLKVIDFEQDFDRSICCLAFSKHDCGTILAVVDESSEHTITLLEWQRDKHWRVAEANSGHEPVLAIDFHPMDKYSLVAVGKSSVNFWDLTNMRMSKKSGFFDKFDKPKYVSCLTFSEIGEILTGDTNGSIMIWSLGANRPRKIIPNVHPGGVLSIVTMKNWTFLTGGRDRRIIEWDEDCTPTGRECQLPEHFGGIRYITNARGNQVLIGTLRNCILMGSMDDNFTLIMQGHSESISALATHPAKQQYLTGGADEQIYVYDAITHRIIWTKCLMMPVASASYSPRDELIIIGSTKGRWSVIDNRSQEVIFTKCDGSSTINCIKFSVSGLYFAMGSADTNIYIYKVTESGDKFWLIGACSGHSSPIMSMDWSIDETILRSQSINSQPMYWRAAECRRIDDLNSVDHVHWHTQNCSIGLSSIGIWPNDDSVMEYCEKSHSEDLIATSTDSGFINIFRLTSNNNQLIPHRFNGHTDKINNLKFLIGDHKLIAIGSKSCVTTEWLVQRSIIDS